MKFSIDNLVSHAKSIYKIYLISHNEVGLQDLEGRMLCSFMPITPKDIEPIPLTPEWLERAGFEHLEKTNVWINQIALYQYDAGFVYETNLFEDSELIPIHYVHTLQNLYFALTGKELEFNLDNLN